MIALRDIITRYVRKQMNFDMEMRIGVHSGSVLCGVLGLQKWQFDVWSWDVGIANMLEAGGIPGWVCVNMRIWCVWGGMYMEHTGPCFSLHMIVCCISSSRIHISRATLDCLEGTYKTEDGHGRDRNEFLRRHNIDTFFICPQEERRKPDHTEAPKVHKTIRTWNPEITFASYPDMNSVGPGTQTQGNHCVLGFELKWRKAHSVQILHFLSGRSWHPLQTARCPACCIPRLKRSTNASVML